MSPRLRRELLKRIYALLAVVVLGAIAWGWMIRMPGKSFNGPARDDAESLAPLRAELAADVKTLAGDIGERNVEHYEKLRAAADFIEQSLMKAGLDPRRAGYEVDGKICENIEVEIPGANEEIVVIGAHYDSVLGSPGANDNGSGLAALLALARRFSGSRGARTLRFVAFANEEPGHFQTEQMGSWVYASRCKARGDRISAMISLETIGYFSDEPHSQKFPIRGLGFLYPTTGNFIAFVANTSSRKLMQQALKTFRRHARIPSEGAALPSAVSGVGWSDHWAFWKHGYPAFMITDTAPFRYPHYHARSDTPDKLDYRSMARLVDASEHMIRELVGRTE
jgi:hypothetical protein